MSPEIAPGKFWWQEVGAQRVSPFDYPPERLAAARAACRRRPRRLEDLVAEPMRRARTPEELVRRLAYLVQGAVMHPPLWQPAETKWGYWWWRWLVPIRASWWPRAAELLGQELILDPLELLELGEARCGQVAALLGALLGAAGLKWRLWQLPRHIVVEVDFAGDTWVVDADAFKHGLMLEVEGRLARKREIVANPYIVDHFKPTGWMFRRDSIYARDPRSGRRHRGYVDFYSPEVDGQISARYDAPAVLLPPGAPRWTTGDGPLQVRRGQLIEVAFNSPFPERASGYRVRCGRISRGYTHDRLVLANLLGETSNENFERDLRDPWLGFRLDTPGRHFLAAAAVPAYWEEHPSYIWWSDELVIDVV